MRSALKMLACATLATAPVACGRPEAVRESTANAPRIQITPPRIGDSDPHLWQARAPRDYPVHGVDISRFQTQVDWPEARAAGVNFAFIKATEGGDLADPMFDEHWRGAARAGVKRGAYHFFYHCRPAAEQARWFIAHVPRAAGALPPVLDIEWTPFSPTCTRRPPAAEERAEAATFMNLLAAHYGQPPILYTTVDFFAENEMWRLSGNEFWLRSVAGHPAERYGGQHWTFWQYTGTGLVPGIAGEADVNVFAGSSAAWAEWLAQRAP